jgi:hypothetical protein
MSCSDNSEVAIGEAMMEQARTKKARKKMALIGERCMVKDEMFWVPIWETKVTEY